MMNELKFWQLDTHEVGTESDEEGMDEEDITQLLGKGIDADGNEEGHSDKTMAERMIAAFEDEGSREKEREALVTKELNISRFQVEPEVEQCMTDFYRKPYAEIHEIKAEAAEVGYEQAVNYYDNDDGFWNDYIDHKRDLWQANPMIVHRRFFKH